MNVAHYQCKQILRDHYFRFDPVFPSGKTIGLDDVKKIPELVAFAEKARINAMAA